MAGDWCCWALAIVLENVSRIWFWAWRWRPLPRRHATVPAGRSALMVVEPLGVELCHKRQAGPWRTFQPQVCNMQATVQRLTSISKPCCSVRGRLAARQHCSLKAVLPAAWTPGRALRERLDGIMWSGIRAGGQYTRRAAMAQLGERCVRNARSRIRPGSAPPTWRVARVVWDHKVGLVIGVRSCNAQKRLPTTGQAMSAVAIGAGRKCHEPNFGPGYGGVAFRPPLGSNANVRCGGASVQTRARRPSGRTCLFARCKIQ